MATRRYGPRRTLRISTVVVADHGNTVDFEAAEDLFARLVAKTFLADHPEFAPSTAKRDQDIKNAGPRPHLRAGRALTPRGAGSAESEREHVEHAATG